MKKFKGMLLACDMDGTLLDAVRTVSDCSRFAEFTIPNP